MICKKSLFNCILISFFCFLIFTACGVSTGEIISANDAGEMPVLQVCPPAPEGPSISGEMPTEDPMESFYNMFSDPVSVEESSNNIIVVDADVAAVEVYLNNLYLGKSKITVMDLTPGQYILELKKNGYEDFSTFVNVNSNRKNYYYFKMVPKKK